MYSAQLLKAAVHDAMIRSFTNGSLLYFPMGIGDRTATFKITSTFPESEAVFTDNAATLTVSGPISGDYSNHSTYASPVLQFTSYAIAEPDAAFLAECVANWCLRLSNTDLSMQGQIVNWINIVRSPRPGRNSKNQLWFSSFDAQFHLHVLPDDASPPVAQAL